MGRHVRVTLVIDIALLSRDERNVSLAAVIGMPVSGGTTPFLRQRFEATNGDSSSLQRFIHRIFNVS